MATQKVSVTIGDDTLAEARELVGPRGLSAFVDDALREKLDREVRRMAFLAYLEELEADDPATDGERRRATRRADQIRRIVEG